VLPIYIPPLRERQSDIPLLAEFFLEKFRKDVKKHIRGFTPEAMEVLLTHAWPGNVRELENAVERAVVIAQGDWIAPESFILQSLSSNDEERYKEKSLKDAVNLFKAHFVRRTLEKKGWNQTNAAKELGIQRTYLSRLLKELNIQK
jgi:Nif-specific regulatory protein